MPDAYAREVRRAAGANDNARYARGEGRDEVMLWLQAIGIVLGVLGVFAVAPTLLYVAVRVEERWGIVAGCAVLLAPFAAGLVVIVHRVLAVTQ
jgi:hypothetical protein